MPAYAMSLLATLAAAMLVLSGCSAGPKGEDDPRVRVVASTNIYGQIAEEIGGDRVTVTSIIDSGAQDPHAYESTARDQLAVQRAQLAIENGGGYDEFFTQLIKAAGNGAADGGPVVITAVGFLPEGFLPEADAAGDELSEHDHALNDHDNDHDHELNEHVWFDPATMIGLARQIAADLGALDPEGAEGFAANAATFAADLEGVQAQLAQIAAEHAGEGVFLTEPLAGYLVTAADLVDLAPEGFAAAVESGRDVSPATLLASLRVVESGDVRAVLVNGQTAGAETKRVMDAATTAGVPIVAFTETLPDGSGADAITTYVDWMSDNVKRLATALGA